MPGPQPNNRPIDANHLGDPTQLQRGIIPPSDLPAQEAIVSSILLLDGGRSVIDRCVQVGLEPKHFYGDDFRIVYESILRVEVDGLEIGIVEVAADLRERELLDRCGGMPFLVKFVAMPFELTRVEQHARRLIDLWKQRAAIAFQQKMIARMYHPQGVKGQELLEELEVAAWQLAHDQRETSYQHAAEIAGAGLRELAEAASNGMTMLGAPSGFPDLDQKIGGYIPSDLIIVAARPGAGKTSWAVSTMLQVTKPPSDGSLPYAGYFHTYEMPRQQIAFRLVCSLAGVQFAKLRLGTLTRLDWDKLLTACQELARHPIYIDDRPSGTVPEFRANVRKINRDIEQGRIQAKPVALSVADYLQLMKGAQGAGREQEISSLSRGLKELAKTEKTCVMALSQLNRDVEKRAGQPQRGRSGDEEGGGKRHKRPQLSDLRECIAADQWVYDSGTGDRVQIKDLQRGETVASLDYEWKIRRRQTLDVWSVGVKPVLKLTTRSGRTLRATANHPLRVLEGWKRLDQLEIGESIAVPRSVPEPEHPYEGFSRDELCLLGYLISDGSYLRHRSVGYVKNDPELVDHVREIALSRFGIVAKDHPCQGPSQQIELTVTGQGRRHNPLIAWLKQLDLHGQIGQDKRIPDDLLKMSNWALGVFLGALWAGDGSVVKRTVRGGWVLKFTSTSFVLLEQIMWILSRLGIVGQLGKPTRHTKSTMPIATILIGDQEHIRRFAEVAPMRGIKGKKLQAAASQKLMNKPNIDRMPVSLNDRLIAEKELAGHSWSTLGYRVQGKAISRDHLSRVADKLGSKELKDLSRGDVLWDPIVSIVPDGESECFDVSVIGIPNFVCQNICVHNSGSQEQDADTVIFIYREQYYDKSANDEAELIIAKQRNGETCTVRCVFDGPMTTFRPLQKGYEEFSDFGEDGGTSYRSLPYTGSNYHPGEDE